MFYTMYNKNYQKPRRTRSASNGGSAGRPGNSFSRGRRNFSGKTIDINKFINKAVPSAPTEVYTPKRSFADYPIAQPLKRALAKRGYTQPMSIQDQTIPHILAGKDVIGLANTGTGKTAAFLIPLIHKMIGNPNQKVLIVTPTRELAIQIRDEFVSITEGIPLSSIVLVGGANIRTQIMRLRSKQPVVIGTPGRLKDLIERKKLNLTSYNNIVLDEADQMLDKGFLPDVRYLMSLAAESRQTLLFSATLSPEINRLTETFLKNPVRVSIKKQETSAQVEQDIIRITQNESKIEVLHDVLNREDVQKTLIFTRTKFGAEKLSKVLHQRGFKSESIHGNKAHNKRQKALQQFKSDVVNILVATDIAARGLDIPDVSHVINYDIPATYEDYIHRIGRTGRADKTGKALTFVG